MTAFPATTVRVTAIEPAGETKVRITLEMLVDVHRLAEVGSELLDIPPQQFGAFIRSELAKYEALAKSAGLKLE